MAQAADWYADPSGRYQYRYWDGYQWTNQVSSGGPSALDPNPLDASVINVPPPPGSQAATPVRKEPEPVAPQPAVQVSQSGGNTSFGVVLGALLALIAVIVLVIVLLTSSDDGTTDTTVPTDTTEEPAPAPTTGAPEE